MNQTDLNRIQEDLDTIKQAAGLELPFSAEDVKLSLWSAFFGVLVTVCAVLVPWEYRYVILAPIGLAALFTGWSFVSVRRKRTHQPGRWREHRTVGIAALTFLPLAIGYKYWERSIGMPREMIGAAVIFFLGVGLLVIAATNRKRLYYLGAAIPLMVFGLTIPLCSQRQVMITAGIWWITSCLAAAAIQAWQLRTHGADHAAD